MCSKSSSCRVSWRNHGPGMGLRGWSLRPECWSFSSLPLLVFIFNRSCRASQVLLRGSVKKLKLDDYLMVIAMVRVPSTFYCTGLRTPANIDGRLRQLTDTVLIVAMNIITNTNSNLIDPSHPTSLSPEDIRQREFGSKMVLLAEQMQCVTIWLIKACLLLMYHRLT